MAGAVFWRFVIFLFRWDVSIRVAGQQGDRRSQVFIFGEPADVEKAQDWIKSWIGPMDICGVGSAGATRGLDAELGEGRDTKGCNETKEIEERESRRRPGESLLGRKERGYERRDAARRGTKRGEVDEGAGRLDTGRFVGSPVPSRGNLVSKLLEISGQYPESPSPQSQEDLRAKLDKQRKQNKEVQDVSKTSRGKSLARLSREMGVLKKPEMKSGSPMRFGGSTEEDIVDRDDVRRSSGLMRRDRRRSTGRLVQEKNNRRELRSKSTSRLKVEEVRGRSASQASRETSDLPASHLEAEKQGRITRSMSAARDLSGNGGGRDAGGKNQEGGRRNLTREERSQEGGRRDTMRWWGSSWQQLQGRGSETQQQHKHEEKTSERMRSISTGRIPLEGGRRSISSTRVGISARRVRQIT